MVHTPASALNPGPDSGMVNRMVSAPPVAAASSIAAWRGPGPEALVLMTQSNSPSPATGTGAENIDVLFRAESVATTVTKGPAAGPFHEKIPAASQYVQPIH